MVFVYFILIYSTFDILRYVSWIIIITILMPAYYYYYYYYY